MNYKKGYTIKPLKSDEGVIIFTDGTNEIKPSQKSCLAYGYKWDAANGTCIINQKLRVNVAKKINNSYNNILGRANRLGGAVDNSVVAGEGNKLEGNNKNIIINGNNNLVKAGVFNSSIISGDQNTLYSGVNNSTVISGVGAVSIRDNETVIGGFYHNGIARTDFSLNPFTTQTSLFNMQSFIALSASPTSEISPLKTQEGNDYIKLHQRH